MLNTVPRGITPCRNKILTRMYGRNKDQQQQTDTRPHPENKENLVKQ